MSGSLRQKCDENLFDASSSPLIYFTRLLVALDSLYPSCGEFYMHYPYFAFGEYAFTFNTAHSSRMHTLSEEQGSSLILEKVEIFSHLLTPSPIMLDS